MNIHKIILKKALVRHGHLNHYKLEPAPSFSEFRGILGTVKENYSDTEILCPVVFFLCDCRDKDHSGTIQNDYKNSVETFIQNNRDYSSLILFTIQEMTGADTEWLNSLPEKWNPKIRIYHYGPDRIQALLADAPEQIRFFYGEYRDEAGKTKTGQDLIHGYMAKILDEFKYIHFVGMPTGSYQKQKLLKQPELVKVYIELGLMQGIEDTVEKKPLDLLKKKNRAVLLGNPGSGKTTLLKHLALSNILGLKISPKLRIKRIPFYIPINEWVKRKKEQPHLFDLIGYLKHSAETRYGFRTLDREFFITLLQAGVAILLIDGLDEAVHINVRRQILQEIENLAHTYPDLIIWVTSRIVGYKEMEGLNPSLFDKYYLAPVSRKKAEQFIDKWFRIQIPSNEALQRKRTDTLKRALDLNPDVAQLMQNPLLLTMMTLVHQFEGTLPTNRVKLYEKCIELLIKTWQDHKYSMDGETNDLEKRGLNYNTQLRLLATVALHIRERIKTGFDKDTGLLIAENELKEVLLTHWSDNRRRSQKQTREDIEQFLDYIRHRTGLIIQAGQDENGSELFSFMHLSFMEYLCAYAIAEDRSFTMNEHIRRLILHIHDPLWEEPLLLALHMFDRSGTVFIDSFMKIAFDAIKQSQPSAWLLLGKALRDNLNIAKIDKERIISEVVRLWLKAYEPEVTYSILEAIVKATGDGKEILNRVLRDNIGSLPAPEAFQSLYLYKRFTKTTNPFLWKIISRNPYRDDLAAYLPVYWNDKVIVHYIRHYPISTENWFRFFDSSLDKTLLNLHCIINKKWHPNELKGYVLHAWKTVLLGIKERDRLNAALKAEGEEKNEVMTCTFSRYAGIRLNLHRMVPEMRHPVPIIERDTIKEPLFGFADQATAMSPDKRIITEWIQQLVKQTLSALKNNGSGNQIAELDDQNLKKVQALALHLIQTFFQDRRSLPVQEFFKELIKGSSSDFLRRYIHLLNQQSSRQRTVNQFLMDFNRHVATQYEPTESFLKFGRDFDWTDIGPVPVQFSRVFLRHRMQHLRQQVKQQIIISYEYKYKQKLNWSDWKDEDFQTLEALVIDELSSGNQKFMESFVLDIYECMFLDELNITVSTNPIGNTFENIPITPMEINPDVSGSVTEGFLLPFLFQCLPVAALHRYMIGILDGLRIRFANETDIDMNHVIAVVDGYCTQHPFILHLLSFVWENYSMIFKQLLETDSRTKAEQSLVIASIIMNAAKIGVTSGMPCRSSECETVLKSIDPSTKGGLYADISLKLYELAANGDTDNQSGELIELLERFKKEHPEEAALVFEC